MRPGLALVLTLVVAACASTPEPIPEPVQVASEQEPLRDPRVDHLQTRIVELLDRLEILQARVNRMEDVLLELSERGSGENGDAAVNEQAVVERYLSASDAAEAYRVALILIAEGKMEEARDRLELVYRTDPSGDLADNALYWIGETYFEAGAFRDAVRSYDRVLEGFPRQNKAPDALLRKALALVELGDLALARENLQRLVENYPYSTAASAGRLELERIRY